MGIDGLCDSQISFAMVGSILTRADSQLVQAAKVPARNLHNLFGREPAVVSPIPVVSFKIGNA
jgi:hypothetical protein